MANTKHEDAIMKMGFGYFRNSILKRLGVDYEFVADEPTELIELQIHSMYMDFTFMTTDGFYVHFEFQTTETERADLQRFEAYDADKNFSKLKTKRANEEPLTDEDFAGLALAFERNRNNSNSNNVTDRGWHDGDKNQRAIGMNRLPVFNAKL